MKIYANKALGKAWQYEGDMESMPSWAKESSEHRVEIDKDGVVRYWKKGNKGIIVEKGDWFVMFYGDQVTLYSNDAFKLDFISSEPNQSKNDAAPLKKYRSKPRTVDAWQYTGEIHLSELSGWVSDLILYNRLGYRPWIDPKTKNVETLFMFRDEDGMWTPLSVGDWLVRGDANPLGVLSDNNSADPIVLQVTCDDFKKSFEEIKPRR